jgi:4-alpha-glucanotransferase
MEVLVFAFDGSLNNPYLPRNHIRNSVVYTGTHDTNTARGWFEREATEQEKAILSSYIGGKVTEGTVASELVKLAMMSVSDLCVIPLQDHLGLGTEARMNDPAVSENNWQWRVDSRQLSRDLFQGIGKDTLAYGRA